VRTKYTVRDTDKEWQIEEREVLKEIRMIL